MLTPRLLVPLAATTLLLAACSDRTTEPATHPRPAAPTYDDGGNSAAAMQVLHAAVNAALEGAIIEVGPGTYNETILISTSGLRLHAAAGAVLDGSGTGIGIHVLGTSTALVTDVEVSGFEVENFDSGIVVEWGRQVRVHRNDVHDNLGKDPSLPLGDATGIDVRSTHDTEVSENVVHHNGARGIYVRLGSANNTIRVNRVEDNGFQSGTARGGIGIGLTGALTNDNRIEENNVNDNNGWGMQLARPNGTAPLTGNVLVQNRAHGNQRSGIALMGAAKGNSVLQNDARANNLSGLPPCVHCNLVDLSTGAGDPNVFERNLGTFNLTDPTCLTP
jgi:parallel beta-helix repeat protein